jgi:hypothetical protein
MKRNTIREPDALPETRAAEDQSAEDRPAEDQPGVTR